MKKWMSLLLVLVLAWVSLPAEAASLADIQANGEIVLGTNAEFPPYEWVIMKDGKQEIVGMDIELAQKIADDLGVKLVVDNRAFDGLIPSLQSNKVDFVIAGMAYTEERAKAVDFSQSYYRDVEKFVVRDEDADKYQELADFDQAKVGVLKGSIQETYMKEHHPDADLVAIPNNGQLTEMLLAKKIDAVLMTDIVIQQYAANKDGFTILDEIELPKTGEGSSVAVAKNNAELLEAINKSVQEAIDEGLIDQWMKEYSQLAGSKAQE